MQSPDIVLAVVIAASISLGWLFFAVVIPRVLRKARPPQPQPVMAQPKPAVAQPQEQAEATFSTGPSAIIRRSLEDAAVDSSTIHLAPSEIPTLLATLRQRAMQTPNELGSHQLDAHWSLAYACNAAPEPWEIYRAASLYLMPCTKYFVEHEAEIVDALRQDATWELLRIHAVEKLALEAKFTKDERRFFCGFAGSVQFYDANKSRWVSVDVPRVRWFDNREYYREHLEELEGRWEDSQVTARIEKRRQQERSRLERLRDRVIADHTASREYLQSLELQIDRLGGPPSPDPQIARVHEARRPLVRGYLQRLEATRDFGKNLFQILRAAENRVRATHNVPAVGEGWVSETELLYRVRKLFPDQEIVAHGRPRWLGSQHLDIWIPALSVGIEYQGVQHFEAIGFFGGDSGLARARERDTRKRAMCEKHGLRLIEIAYDQTINDEELTVLITNDPVAQVDREVP